MTKRMTNIFYIVMASLLFFACKKDLPTLDINKILVDGTLGTANTNWTGLNITTGKTTDFISYTINPVNTLKIPMVYTLEMDLEANNFSNPVAITTIEGVYKDSTVKVPVAVLNNALLNTYFATVGSSYKIAIRERWNPISSNNRVGDTATKILDIYTVGPVYDDPAATNFPGLTLPGDFKYGNGWTPEYTNVRQVYSLTNNNIYQGFTYIDAGGFKFAKGSWDKDKNWGDEAGSGKYTGKLKEDAGDISIAAKGGSVGFYFITSNIAGLTYECVPFTVFNLIVNGGTTIPMNEVQGIYTTSVSGTYGNQWTVNQNLQPTDKIQFQISGTGLTSAKTITFTLGAPFTTSSGNTRLKQDGVPLTVGTTATKVTLDLTGGLYRCSFQ